MNKTIFKGIGSGTIGGMIASLCCLGPVILALLGIGVFFGISGACFLKYKIPFFTAGMFFIGVAGIFYFKKNKNTCDIMPKNKSVFLVSAVLSMIMIYIAALYFLAPFLQSFNGAAACSAF